MRFVNTVALLALAFLVAGTRADAAVCAARDKATGQAREGATLRLAHAPRDEPLRWGQV